MCVSSPLACGDTDLSILKIARILRALRPLRLIGRNPNLKLVVSTLLKARPPPQLCLVRLGG